ncbi:MAG: hypothetical protein PHT94_02680 [Candidatus Nanoarchaeia archaeon]|nr:hypothetical protein [Candidatus Nanoarchaeia archaeon]
MDIEIRKKSKELLEKESRRVERISREYEAFNNHLKIISNFDQKFEKEFENLKKLRNIKFDLDTKRLSYDDLYNTINDSFKLIYNYKDEVELISLDVGYLIYDYIKSIMFCSFDFLLIIEKEMQKNGYIIKEVYESILEINNYLFNFSNNLINILNKKNNLDLIDKNFQNKSIEELLEHNIKYTNSIKSRSFSIFGYFSQYMSMIKYNQQHSNEETYFHEIPGKLVEILNKFSNDIGYFLNYSNKLIIESIEIERKILIKLTEYEELIEHINMNDFSFFQKKNFKKLHDKINRLNSKEVEGIVFEIAKDKKKYVVKRLKQKYKIIKRNVPRGYRIKPKNISKFKY